MTLLIMAAGMGSRFGGLKQIEPVGENGEFIIDYSIYDAKKVGFDKVVFIIKEENYAIFKNTIGKRIEEKIEVEYVFQDIKNIPDFVDIPSSRVKPWGTAHAVLCAKDKIHEPFAIINADDFYGRDAFQEMAKFLKNAEKDYAMIGYQIENTLTENGSVKRGVCREENHYLKQILESDVSLENGQILVSPFDGRESFIASKDMLVSMNFFGFTPSLFSYLEKKQDQFFKDNQDNLEKCEFLIPEVVEQLINEKEVRVHVLPTTAKWLGITYKEDKDELVRQIKALVEKGLYPKNLWE